ncbi:EIIAB-Man [Sebaldella termitidis]|jgi:fructoselysine and glucoselysine-specific PTS system IIA component|uniref:PTS system fructose subfamily IIA component n=1 Tax=Sebaldella termitidis (strain ATCC 33386 / NCTC 11300) TaxID=526218 RepID=D1AQQ3_SEBTE|nr:PTS fructose subfamily transporter subunit IIA [Sebaldella termitidis]ACZ10313.1 PTS system fructose subfamily IIA component [Sebaldella termitidis ATCC 33386]SUI25652.1 EIIAB-Man [Sebaldella termitidis]
MRKFLIASHAYLAKGMYSSLELIMGKQEHIHILCAYTSEEFDIKQEIQKILLDLSREDELIILTDVFGGSVNNEFFEVMAKNPDNIFLVSGVNLPLIMNLISRSKDEKPTSEIINESIQEAIDSICFCNELTENENGNVEEDEEF